MTPHKIIPSLWFNSEAGHLAIVIEYYSKLFEKDFIAGNIVPLGQTPSGNAEMCEVYLFEKKYSFMSTEKLHHTFNDALSLTLVCENQQEIDKYWNYFTQEGQEVQCGWCIDKFGLRWQIIPVHLGELLRKPNAWQVMMKQKKIIIEAYN